MDLSSTIIGVLMLSLFIIPVILLTRAGKAKGKKFEKEFFSEVSRMELNISEKDFWNEYAIGIDKSKKRILYMDWSVPETRVLIIDIKDVKTIEPTPGFKEMNKKGFNYSKGQRLAIKLCHKDNSRMDINILFFVPGFGEQSDNDVKLFEKWLKLIMAGIDSRSADNLKHSA